MSTGIPAALKAADVARFAHRAGQLEKARPAVAYWCNYWIVEQIIAKNLHQADEDSKAYTMQLMDKLEQIKVDYAENDAIVDDMAGHAYVEQFGQETFQRADNAMKAGKASRQTADTFQAAATFLELCQIWGPLDSDIASKIKFAKFHALRIAKAIKAGEDPNATKPEALKTPDTGSVEQPSVQDPSSQPAPLNHLPDYQPSVQDLADHQIEDGPGGPHDVKGNVEHYYQSPPQPDVSPLAPSSRGLGSPDGGGYFPNVSEESVKDRAAQSMYDHSRSIPPVSQPTDSAHDIRKIASEQPGSAFAEASPGIPTTMSGVLPQATATIKQEPTSGDTSSPAVTYRDDEGAIMAAQKHAKFAISALNFEDVSTAVKELREALASLGA